MSSDVQTTLSKLDTLLGKNRRKNKTDFKELNELRKKSFLKLKEGKNQVAFVKPLNAADPFFVWGFHNSLQEVSYYSIPCNQFNNNENCIICNVIEQLQKEDFEGNKHLWSPIRQQTEIYAPVINLESEATINEGLKWLRLPRTITNQLTEWLRNLEKGEEAFYSDTEPQKVLITYDKNQLPMSQYNVDKKNMKAFSEQQLIDWKNALKPVSDFIIPKSEAETKKIVDAYFERISLEINNVPSSEGTQSSDVSEEEIQKAKSKLDSLKNH